VRERELTGDVSFETPVRNLVRGLRAALTRFDRGGYAELVS
jgi:hypothetical protein